MSVCVYLWILYCVGVCMYVLCIVRLCVCKGFVKSGCVYVRVLKCMDVCMNVCMGFEMCGCVYAWVL